MGDPCPPAFITYNTELRGSGAECREIGIPRKDRRNPIRGNFLRYVDELQLKICIPTSSEAKSSMGVPSMCMRMRASRPWKVIV
jgi:hypothetical protein